MDTELNSSEALWGLHSYSRDAVRQAMHVTDSILSTAFRIIAVNVEASHATLLSSKSVSQSHDFFLIARRHYCPIS